MARCAREGCGRWRPDALVRQRAMGVRLDDDWYCSTACLERAVRARLAQVASEDHAPAARMLPPLRIGVLLLANDATLTPDLIGQALEAQRRSGRRLGDELQRMGVVTAQQVLHALAAQANTRYLTAIDPAMVQPGHGNLSRDMVRALGLVPFGADAGTRLLKVAYVAPLPRMALAALRELTGWRPEPYLVADQMWPLLAEAYGATAPDLRTRASATAGTLGDASSRIARTAGQARTARISHARLDPYVWVRVETSNQVEDVLVNVPPADEDTSCPMAHTSH